MLWHLFYFMFFFAVDALPPDLCPETPSSALPECSLEDSPTSNRMFSYTSCYTPVVTKVNVSPAVTGIARSVTTSTLITIHGLGFADQACANIITLGYGDVACSCTIIEISDTNGSLITCQLITDCAKHLWMYREISVLVIDKGYAHMRLSRKKRSLILFPEIHSIAPNVGSREGGTEVILTGTGLGVFTTAMFRGSAASCERIDESSIKCTTPKSGSGEVTLEKNGLSAVCGITDGTRCLFEFSLAITPEVLNVNPSTVSGPVELTLTGDNFGVDESAIKVWIGTTECLNVKVIIDNKEVTCELTGLTIGVHSINMIVINIGRARTAQTVIGQHNLDSVQPTQGSIFGGTQLSLKGNGFSKGDTTVMIDDTYCDIEDEETTSLQAVCVTKSHAAGTFDIIVLVNKITFSKIKYTYSEAVTPRVDTNTNSPLQGVPGSPMTLTGEKFGSDFTAATVILDGEECNVLQAPFADNELMCTLDTHASGKVDGVIHVSGKGFSNTFSILYEMLIENFQPTSG